MEHGENVDQPVLGYETPRLTQRPGIRSEIAVREHRSLRPPRGATGIEQAGEITRHDWRRREHEGFSDSTPDVRHRIGKGAGPERIQGERFMAAVELGPRRVAQHQRWRSIINNPLRLGVGIRRVQRQKDCTHMRAGEIDQHHGDALLGLNEDPITLPYAKFGERVDGLCDFAPHCPRRIRPSPDHVDDRTPGVLRTPFGKQDRESKTRRIHQGKSLPDSYAVRVTVALFLDPGFRTTDEWLEHLSKAMPDEKLMLFAEIADPAIVEIALVRGVNPGALSALPSLQFVQCLWAGIERLLDHPDFPPDIPLARMIDPAMAAQMAATVAGHVLDIHLDHGAFRIFQAESVWRPLHARSISERTVGILGLGALGSQCAAVLRALGFSVIGWRASVAATSVDHLGVVTTPHLAEFTARADIVVNLLPVTEATVGILDAQFFAALGKGASIINVARGAHLIDDDLIAALDCGHLNRAVLDVFRAEPLPLEHPFWKHPAVTITPHVAAETDPRTASAVIAANVRAWRSGEPVIGLVDRGRAY